MPSDSIITTTMTSTMVRIITGSKIGVPKWKGMISANQPASATLSKCIIPRIAAITAPVTMPTSTAIFDRKPRAYFITRMIASSTSAAISMFWGAA